MWLKTYETCSKDSECDLDSVVLNIHIVHYWTNRNIFWYCTTFIFLVPLRFGFQSLELTASSSDEILEMPIADLFHAAL